MLRSRPSFLLTALLAVAACGGKSSNPPTTPATTPPPAPAAGAEPTTAEEVIERSIAAAGGRAVMEKMTTMKTTGTVTIPQMGAKGSVLIEASAPSNMVTTIDIPGIGKIQQGVTADVAWEVNPMTGARILKGEERAVVVRQATFNADLAWKQHYPKAELAGIADHAGTASYKVVLTPKPGEGEPETRYYAKDTFLPVGSEMVVTTQMGKVPATVQFLDYKDVQGMKVAHKMVRKDGPVNLEIVLEAIEVNPSLPPTTFELPAAIQKLQAKAK